MATDDRVRVVTDNGVLTVELNAPERLNAFDTPMLTVMGDAVLGAGEGVKVIVLRGAGRGFCAGADLSHGADTGTIGAVNRLVNALVESPLPVVSVVQGPCAGAGVPIALAADLVIASTDAFFQLAFTRIGLMPDAGATALVAAAVGRIAAARMALLAERIDAEQAHRWGLVSQVLPPDELAARVDEIVDQLNRGPGAAYRLTKAAINAATLGGLGPALAREHEGQTVLLASPDFAEGSAAFLQRRPPVFTDR